MEQKKNKYSDEIVEAYRYFFYRERKPEPNFYWEVTKTESFLQYKSWNKGKYKGPKEDKNRVYSEVTKNLIIKVLESKKTIGVNPFVDLQNVFYGKKDYDVHADEEEVIKTESKLVRSDCIKDCEELNKRGFEYGRDYIVNSSGSKGLHLHVFTNKPINGKVMRAFLYNISNVSGTIKRNHEVFPKQEKLDYVYSTDLLSTPNGSQTKQALCIHPKHRKKALIFKDISLSTFETVNTSLDNLQELFKNKDKIKEVTITEDEMSWYKENIVCASKDNFDTDINFSGDSPNCPDKCEVFEFARSHELAHPIHNYYDINAWIYAHNSETDKDFLNDWNAAQNRTMAAYYGDDESGKFSCGLIITHLKNNEDNENCQKALACCLKCKENFVNQKEDLIKFIYDKVDGADTISERLAEEIQEEYNPKSIINDKDKKIHFFDGKMYKASGEDSVSDYCAPRLKWKYKKMYRKLVFDKVRDRNFVQDTFFIDNSPNQKYINLQNGIFNLETKELTEHSKKLFFDYCFPFSYDKDIKCNKILEFFNTSIGDDANSFLMLQEFFGYLLMRSNQFKKILINIGQTNSGKTILQSIIQMFLPNTSSINAAELIPGTKELEPLIGSWANLTGEIMENEVLENQVFIKQLSGNDPINLMRKYLTSVPNFINKAKIVINGNSLPAIKNKDDFAFMERCLFLNFNYSFMEKSKYDKYSDIEKTERNIKLAIKDLEKELLTEDNMQGLFNWALIGYDRLMKQEGFTVNEKTSMFIEEWQNKTDSLQMFYDKYLIADSKSIILTGHFNEMYIRHCKEFNVPLNRKATIKMIDNLLSKKGNFARIPKNVNNHTHRVITGFKWQASIIKDGVSTPAKANLEMEESIETDVIEIQAGFNKTRSW